MEIIGLSGFARAGKDEAAKVLAKYGFKRVAFADKLREVLYALNPIVATSEPFFEVSAERYTYVQDVIDKYGWDGYKESNYGAEVRRLLQRLGTEAGRQTMGENIWVDTTMDTLDREGKYVVTDARFFNEFEAIRSRGGLIWRIERFGVGPANDHPSETEAVKYPHFTRTIRNDGSLRDYQKEVEKAYELYETGRRIVRLATEAVD